VKTADGGPGGIRTRVSCPPRAFLVRSVSCVVLTQHLYPRDSNSAGILAPVGYLLRYEAD
jgi:hypothetical protein